MIKKSAFLFAFALIASCQPPADTSVQPELKTTQTTDLSSLQFGQVDSFDISIDLVKQGVTSFSHHKSSYGLTRVGESPDSAWFEHYSGWPNIYWDCSFKINPATSTLDIYSGFSGMQEIHDLRLEGMKIAYDQSTKILTATIEDPKLLWGKAINYRWTFDKTNPGEREGKSWHEGYIDSLTTVNATVHLKFK